MITTGKIHHSNITFIGVMNKELTEKTNRLNAIDRELKSDNNE